MVEHVGQASLIGRSLGNYAVEALLGRGATGAVYLAKDTALGRPVALKVLLGSLARSPEQVARFLEEARAVAPLQHPHIVGVYEAGIRDGTPFIAMEYIQGEALDRFLRRNAPLNWRHALYIASQVAGALHCAHDAGIVHRDVKPANILLDRLGHVRLTDFGIARVQEEVVPHGQGYSFFGTPDYMSPEQCGSGAPIGRRSDFFALGVMLFEMMTGSLPFTAESIPARIQQIVHEEVPRLNRVREDIPDVVARLVAVMLEKSPQRRPATGEIIHAEIVRIQQQDGDASAVPAALNAFIREMAVVPEGRADTPLPGERRPLRAPQMRLRPEQKRLAPISFFAQSMLVLFILLGMVGVSYWHIVEAPRPIPRAVLLDSELLHVDASEHLWVQLPAPHWMVARMAWVGDQEVALVSVKGRPGTAYDGSTGILAVDAESRQVWSVGAPVGPLFDTGLNSGHLVSVLPGAMPAGGASAPLANAFVVPFFSGKVNGEGGYGLIQALAQSWEFSAPGDELLFQMDASVVAPAPPEERWASTPPTVPVAIHPNGYTLAMLLYDVPSGNRYIAERDVRWRDPARIGRRLTTTTDAITGHSMRYSDNGERLAYLRGDGTAEQSLWVIDTRDAVPNGVPVATGRLGGYAFNPDGTRVAVTHERDGESHILFVDTVRGRIEGSAGPGRCDAASWHPTQDYLVVQAPDDDSGAPQLWRLDTTPPYVRTRLTQLEAGAQQPASLSRSGRWLGTASDTDQGPAVLLVPHRDQEFSGQERNAL